MDLPDLVGLALVPVIGTGRHLCGRRGQAGAVRGIPRLTASASVARAGRSGKRMEHLLYATTANRDSVRNSVGDMAKVGSATEGVADERGLSHHRSC